MKIKLLRQELRYLIVGAATASIYIGLLTGLEWGGVPTLAANFVAYAIATLLSYLGTYYWTFESRVDHAVASQKYGVLVSLGVLCNSVFVYILVEKFQIASQIAAVLFLAGWTMVSFLIQKHVVFKPKAD